MISKWIKIKKIKIKIKIKDYVDNSRTIMFLPRIDNSCMVLDQGVFFSLILGIICIGQHLGHGMSII
jgi:hypothetical protein